MGVLDQVVKKRIDAEKTVEKMGNDVEQFRSIPLWDGFEVFQRDNALLLQFSYEIAEYPPVLGQRFLETSGEIRVSGGHRSLLLNAYMAETDKLVFPEKGEDFCSTR